MFVHKRKKRNWTRYEKCIWLEDRSEINQLLDRFDFRVMNFSLVSAGVDRIPVARFMLHAHAYCPVSRVYIYVYTYTARKTRTKITG